MPDFFPLVLDAFGSWNGVNYGLPFDINGGAAFGPLYFPWMLLGAPLINAFGNMLGTFIAWAIARTHTPLQLGEKVGLGALFGTLTFIIEFYSQRDGSTDGGRYNPRIDPADTPYPDTRSDFAGYPDKAGSPYHLPYAADSAMYVGQANLGFFSHARWNSFPQVYAYDFAHDFGDEILAIRDGTVVDFFDWIPDNINPSTAQENTARTWNEPVSALNDGSAKLMRPRSAKTRRPPDAGTGPGAGTTPPWRSRRRRSTACPCRQGCWPSKARTSSASPLARIIGSITSAINSRCHCSSWAISVRPRIARVKLR